MTPNDPKYFFHPINFVEGSYVLHVYKLHDYTMLHVGVVAFLVFFFGKGELLTPVTPFDLTFFFHPITFVENVKTLHVLKLHDNNL